MRDSVICTRKLTHTYGSGALQKVALQDVSLEIERGSCVAIIGVTGSGKSTLIQHFNGLLSATAGEVLVDGQRLGARGVDMRRVRQQVGMLFQAPETQLFAPTLFEDVAFGPTRMHVSRHEVRARVHAALEIVGLPHQEYAHRSPFDLSGGQRRRAALAGVLSMTPQVLILDEPTVGLDAAARQEFYSYLQRIREEQGVTIVLVSHDMAEVAALADQLFVLHQGRLVMQGPPRLVYAQSAELRAWGLAVPPLSALLQLLRDKGIAVPETIFTLDDAYTWLKEHGGVVQQGKPGR